jgi:hypothetical protein
MWEVGSVVIGINDFGLDQSSGRRDGKSEWITGQPC